jgi:hypothetical protein
LSKLGVRRLSSGATIAQVLWDHAEQLAWNFLKTGDSGRVLKNAMAYYKLQSLFE